MDFLDLPTPIFLQHSGELFEARDAGGCLTGARELWRGAVGCPDFDIWRYEAWEGDLPRPDSQEKNGGGQDFLEISGKESEISDYNDLRAITQILEENKSMQSFSKLF